jgi:pyruvate dehydrogenase E1 component alpha subunit
MSVACFVDACEERVPEPWLIEHLVRVHGWTHDDAHDAVVDDPDSTFLDHPSVDDFDEEFLVDAYRRMRLIRRFEEAAMDLAEQGEVPGSPHPCIGQEGVAVGTCLALRDSDVIASTHRGHGHLLARGVDPEAMLAEICARETGTNRGRGGTMHMADPSEGVLEQNAIVGENGAHVAGAVLAARLRGEDTVGVTFLGEGAMNQGATAETLNLAALWDLPVVFVCENNQYAVSFHWRDSTATVALPDRAEGLGVAGERVDGQSVLAVYETVSAAVERARSGEGPQFVECQTYRYEGHFAAEEAVMGDRDYRTDAEIEYWRSRRDPIDTLLERLLDERWDQEKRSRLDEAVERTIESAIEHVHDSDQPPAEGALEDVYAQQEYPGFPAPTYR